MNLTPDPTGLGTKTRAEFLALFQAFADTEAAAVKVPLEQNTVMPWLALAKAKPEDLGAIYDYLRTVPAVHNQVERRPHPMPAPAPAATPVTAEGASPTP